MVDGLPTCGRVSRPSCVPVVAPSLLSIQSASQVQEVYQDSPVNIRAKNGIGVPEFALRNPRFSLRDNLPFNYHALDAAKLGINTEDGELVSESVSACAFLVKGLL